MDKYYFFNIVGSIPILSQCNKRIEYCINLKCERQEFYNEDFK